MPDEPTTPDASEPDPGYDSAGVPTFESVREKIEERYATAQGATELDADTAEGKTAPLPPPAAAGGAVSFAAAASP